MFEIADLAKTAVQAERDRRRCPRVDGDIIDFAICHSNYELKSASCVAHEVISHDRLVMFAREIEAYTAGADTQATDGYKTLIDIRHDGKTKSPIGGAEAADREA
ncbi:hypothetical protein [Pseudaminobacter soli (ex Li et al. 2025)]|uniref:Uncharacterized protein n=1 Tax=Pseudaminobacter soli (ex Li et al. 2025) TaxID=1295366 RepID=A0A2P7S2H5_9HYPH|nr:hypothetical protein [Mesorhizobium soli]PSJ56668.1 hypothetical protein C7I85_24245 [Mesorhizobium soli]